RQGRLLGIVTASCRAHPAVREGSVGEIDLHGRPATPASPEGLAIPAGAAQRAWEDLVRFGYVRRGFLGVEMSSAIEDDAGARILTVLPDSPAHRAGIRPGDVITAYGKYAVANTRQLYALVAGTAPHVRIDIGYQRGPMGYLATVELEESVSTPGPRPLPRPVTEPQAGQPVAQETPR
ncbi:MAG: S1C family serine protease, partial [bacterium]